MQPDNINFVAILLAGVANMVIGMVWYSWLFRRPWMKSIGMTNEKIAEAEAKKPSMGKEMSLMFLGALLAAYVLAHVLWAFDAAGYSYSLTNGLIGGFWCAMGFVLPAGLGIKIFENRSWTWLAIHAGYWLAVLLTGGVIISLMQ